VIASLSLGAERTFIMSYDKPPAKPPQDADGNELLLSKRWTLENGSLVVMQGDTQKARRRAAYLADRSALEARDPKGDEDQAVAHIDHASPAAVLVLLSRCTRVYAGGMNVAHSTIAMAPQVALYRTHHRPHGRPSPRRCSSSAAVQKMTGSVAAWRRQIWTWLKKRSRIVVKVWRWT